MCAHDLERLLLEPDALERARNQAQALAALGQVPKTAPSGGIEAAEPPPHLRMPSRDEVLTQDLSLESLPRVHGLDAFVPELADKSPRDALTVLEARFRKDASPTNAALLQAGINRIATVASSSESDREAARKASHMFHETDSRRRGKTDDIWYTGFVDADFGGPFVFDDLIPGWIYWRRPDFRAIGMNDVLSSLTYGCSINEAGGSVVLFENIDYEGRYRNYAAAPGQFANVPYVGDDFNDVTSSSLLIRRFPNETSPRSIGALVPPGDITDIINQQSGVSAAGDVTFTWDLWPTGPRSDSDWHPADPTKRFVYIIVPLKVHTPWPYPDVNAQARYWVYLYVDGSGSLQGYVAWYGYYTDSCCFLFSCITGQVGDSLLQGIKGTIGKVNALVAKALTLANLGGPYRFSYFLPGRFQSAGNTSDDVTVVAVR